MEIGYTYHIEGEYVKVDMESTGVERIPFNLMDLGCGGDCVLVMTNSTSPEAKAECDAKAMELIGQLLAERALRGWGLCVKIYRVKYPFDDAVGCIGEKESDD